MAYADVNNGFMFLILIWMYSFRMLNCTEVIFKNFSVNETIENIVLNQQNIFLGCTNVIKKLSYTLEEEKSFTTGPIIDSPFCIAAGNDNAICKNIANKKLTDNINKVLLVTNRPQPSLLVCGNVKQGICRFLRLNDLKDISESISSQLSYRVVAPNQDVSALALLVEVDGKQELFVAKTITYIVPLVETKIYPIAVLNLDEADKNVLQPLNFGDVKTNYFMKYSTSGDFVSVLSNQVQKTKYMVEYISTFSFNNFIYITSVQQNVQSESLKYHSKLIRISVSRNIFGRYIEEALSCKKGDVDYNIIVSSTFIKMNGNLSTWYGSSDNDQLLVGLFAQSENEESRNVGSSYAICVFSLNEINEEFESQLDLCKKGKTNINFAKWFRSEAFCTKPNVDPLRVRLAPNKSVSGQLILSQRDVEWGVMETFVHQRGVALFLSTAPNSIEKFSIKPGFTELYKYGKHDFSELGGVFHKMVIDPSRKKLVAVTRRAVAVAPLDDCNNRKTCYDCLSGPYCGWCTLQNKCTFKDECRNSGKTNYFVEKGTKFCPNINNTQPAEASVNSNVKVSFVAANIPTDIQYRCKIKGTSLSVVINGSHFTCDQLDSSTAKPKNGAETFLVSLEAQLESGAYLAIAESSIVVYDCQQFQVCQTCIAGKYSCGWCKSSLECYDDITQCADQASFMPYEGINSSSSGCPRIASVNKKVISYDLPTELELKGHELASPKGDRQYKCIFIVDGNRQNVTASWTDNNTVVCGTTQVNIIDSQLNYYSEKQLIQANIKLEYGNKMIVTNNLTVDVYKCHVQRSDCTLCLIAPAEWKCGWCNSTLVSGKCGISNSCDSFWSNDSCTGPEINSFHPTKIGTGGKTAVTITGSDLGSSLTDIIMIKIAGEICVPVESEYVPSKRIVCKTPEVSGPKEGKIFIKVNSAGGVVKNVTSNNSIFYQQPEITKVNPTVGPCSGGTKLLLSGRNLDVGNKVVVEVNGSNCGLLNRSSSEILCKTKATTQCFSQRVRRSVSSNITVSFDGVKINQSSGFFKYVLDPLVNLLYTNKRLVDLETFVSGGQKFIVEGQRFDIIQDPQMMFHVADPRLKLEASDCNVTGPSLMICLAPNITGIDVNRTGRKISLGFNLDDVRNVRSYRDFTVFPDPRFTFPNGKKSWVIKNNELTLMGTNLHVLDKKDVKVYVGGLPCDVTDLDKRLVCTTQSEEDIKNSGTPPVVTVVIGEGGLQEDVGSVTFFVPVEEEDSIMIYILLPALCVLILLVVIIILCVLYHKRKKKEKEYEALVQVKMDRMESSYARECRNAFAEYQTQFTDLTKDVDEYEPPYLNFRKYAMRVLYPGLTTHPILEQNRDESPEWQECMQDFIMLLKEEDFLLTFVRTVESQSNFHMTDRCIVASLLIVSLQNDLKYVTKILIALLKDLINKVGSSKSPKLLLRRTESVAEKLLTNWLAYTLHLFLENNVGEPLFRLYSAITILLDKDPVDAITFDAKNSLSEDKLLRQNIEFRELIIHVEYVHGVDGGQYKNIKVLTCDTISQTKEKIIKFIYKNRPYSEWPTYGDLQLGFISPNGACLILKDEDTTNVIEGEWKKLNTLEHYKVPDKSMLRLEQLPEPSLSHSFSFVGTGMIGVNPVGTVTSPRLSKFQSSKRKYTVNNTIASMSDLDQSTPAIPRENSLPTIAYQPNHASSPLLHNHEQARERELKFWHMVKQIDFPQEVKDERQSKMMAEVYLTRLLRTKETLHSFVNRLFDALFGLNKEGIRIIPPAVKYLFDFLDQQAETLNIDNPEVYHTWKNNSLPLRFWINMIKNPNFVFDINKSNTVDSCLSVIAQLFMDSCSPDENRLGKDSPSNKLLYAKEIPEYKKTVKEFYIDVKKSDFDDGAFGNALNEISQKYGDTFNSYNAASELMAYATKYKDEIWGNLEERDLERHVETLKLIMKNLPDD